MPLPRPVLILHVDDDLGNRESLGMVLRMQGWSVTEAVDGAGALRLAAEQPDVILLDVRLPDLCGFEVCRRIRSDPATAGIPVIQLSGHHLSKEDRVEALEGGADVYLTKPVDPRELIAHIRSLVRARRAERDLQASEARLRLALEAAGMSTWDWDLVANRLVWSHGYEQLFGLAPGTLVESSETLEERLHPEDREGLDRAVTAAREGRQLLAHEFRVVWSDGSVHWLAGRGGFTYDEQGCPVRMLGVLMDVTERKRVEEDRRRQAQILDQIHDAVVCTDLHGVVTSWNRGAERLHGYRADEMIGQPVSRLYLEHERTTRFAEVVEAMRTCGEFETEVQLQRKDGSVVDAHLSLSLIRDERGNPIGTVGYGLDLTDRRRTEEAVRHLAAIVESSEEAIIGQRLDGIVTSWNPGAERTYGYTAEEMVGRTMHRLAPPDRLDEMLALFEQVVQGKRVTQYETIRLHKEGTPIHVSLTISPIYNTSDTIIGVSTIARDISERKKLEEKLRHSQKMEAVGHLAGGVAHDFNNLLTVITGYSELMLSFLPADDPTQQFVLEIRKAGERAAQLTRQLLAFSRKQILQPVVLDLNAVVTELEKMLNRLIGEDIHLVTALDPMLGHVKADPGQVEQALMNLVVNARDSMPLGGRLTLETRNVELDENYARMRVDVRPGRYVLLAVSDSGCGMTDEVKARVFEPFFTTKEPGKGTGLGLPMVHGFVKQSGGHVEIYSEVNRGTTVKIYLPRFDALGQPTPSGTTEYRMPRGAETVLLAEDEDGVRGLTRLILETNGYTVLTAGDGSEALQIAREYPGSIHLLITDVVMPQMSGRQLADQMMKSHPGIKVLFVSGYTTEAVIRHGVLESGTAFLQKPYTPVTLARKVREVLDAQPHC